MKAYTTYGPSERVDDSQCCSTGESFKSIKFPENGWQDICKAASSTPFQFSMSQIVAFIITRSVTDGIMAGDIKSINKSAENLFICGHVQSIEFVKVDDLTYIRGKCLPEMRKDRIYIYIC